MGRTRLPLQCTKCQRTPEEVYIYSNRYCKDCMKAYNKEQNARRKSENVFAGVQFVTQDPDVAYEAVDELGNPIDLDAEQKNPSSKGDLSRN